jgi:hypothetical protein
MEEQWNNVSKGCNNHVTIAATTAQLETVRNVKYPPGVAARALLRAGLFLLAYLISVGIWRPKSYSVLG